MSLTDFISALWKRKYLMIACIILINIVSVLIIKYVPPIFEASALILFNDSTVARLDVANAQNGSNSQRDQAVQSEVMIAQSEVVLSRAAEISDSVQHLRATRPQIFREDIPPINQAEIFILSKLKVSVEPNTNIIKISFRDNNPVFAAKIANAVAAALRERHITLTTNSGTTDFFRNQEHHYKQELGLAASKLQRYEAENNVFSVKEERRLALDRRDALAKDLAATRGAIQRIDGEINSAKAQAAALRNRINLPPEIFGSTPSALQDQASTTSARQMGQDPSLLHIKVYQELAQKLIMSNTELAGVRALEVSQVSELKAVEQRLLQLSKKDEEYSSLNRNVSAAENYLEILRKRGAEADIDNAWRSNDRLSSLQVIQPAMQPLQPSFPRPLIVAPLGALASLVLSVFLALILEQISQIRTDPRTSAK
ncbi:GumC family protein [Methylobacterium sp. HMF5984]|uniref:GumC family protein n=1 Tax=Methylobacterium sp. HMF5984 TaxID=3367370 RepID=UPI003852DAA3